MRVAKMLVIRYRYRLLVPNVVEIKLDLFLEATTVCIVLLFIDITGLVLFFFDTFSIFSYIRYR